MTNTNTKTKKATVSKTLNKNVKVERFSQVMQDGSINWNDEASNLIDTIKNVSFKKQFRYLAVFISVSSILLAVAEPSI